MKHLMIGLIKLYRRYISPLKRPCCRFTPTCSAYALEAFAKRGFFVGFILTVWRILRCNPFSKGGYDPVPERGLRNPKAVACESEGTVTECDSSPDASCGTAKTVAQKGEDDLANATAQKGEDDLADATAQKSENDSGIHRDNSSKAEAEDGTALHSENVGSIKNLSPSGDSTEE